jgi:PAS domain S-box-containing protein
MKMAVDSPGLRLTAAEVLENIREGFAAFDSDRRFLYVNASAEQILRYSREELLGRHLHEVLPDFAGTEFDRALSEAEPGVGGIELEYFHVPWGRWFSTRFCPSSSGISVYFQDITSGKQTQAALGVSERQYRRLIDSMDQGFCVIEVLLDEESRGVDFRYLEVNRAFEEQTGLADAVGQRVRVLAPTLEDFWFETYGKVALGGEPVRFEREALALGRWFDVYAFRFGSPTSRRVGVLFRDVTARRRVDDALRESEERFRVLVQGMAQAVWETDAEGQTVSDSKSWRELTGLSLERWLSDGWLEAIHPEDREPISKQWQEALAQRKAVDLEYRLRVADGSYRWTNDRAAPLIGADGSVRKWVGMNIDVTERRRTDAALREADRRKDEFLAILAHELRNPLAPLRTGLEIMRLAKGDSTHVEPVRAMMERQIDHLVSLVDDLMDLSRISRGRVELDRRHLDLANVLRGALEACERIIRQQGHELAVSLPPEAVHVFGDMTRLVQAVGNLLTNAAKYTERGGHIVLSLRREGGHAVISVKDDGLGIPAGMLERVFELFTQVGSGVDRSHGGLGIGLTVVRQLVELHGGSVVAHSAGPGKGSEFVIRLPVSAPLPASDSDEAPNRPVPKCRRILVVDDNKDTASSLSTMLELGGHRLHVAHDGREALQVASEQRPEVILMDLGMPNLNGYEAAKRLRQEPWGKDALLVAITGWGQPSDRAASARAGFDHHFVKPVDPAVVQGLLTSLDAP